jgi:hypothetical protein
MAKNINPPTHKSLERSVWSLDGIGLEMPEMHYRKDCKLGSQILREACLDLFCRTANRFHISMDDAMAKHLGTHVRPIIPGCEKAIRGQFAQRKLAA